MDDAFFKAALELMELGYLVLEILAPRLVLLRIEEQMPQFVAESLLLGIELLLVFGQPDNLEG